MIFPPAFLDSSSCWNTNHNNQLQQLANGSDHLTSSSPSAAAAAGGNGNNQLGHQEGGGLQVMAPTAAGAGGDEAAINNNSSSKAMSMSERARLARVPQPEPGLNCPRCDSTNTKFCYFNNYSLTQPRHFCRACRRYWTRGGALRSVPVGGGCRRNKRSSNKSSKPSSSSANRQQLPGGASASSSILPSTAPGSGVPSGAMIPPVGLGSSMAHHLPFLGSMQQHAPGAGPNLGLAFSVGLPPLGIGMHQQQHMDGVDQSSFPLASGGAAATFGASLEQQWRVQQQQPHQQQFPFLELPPPPMYQLGALQANRAAGSGAAAPSGMFTLGQTAASATATAARHERSVKQADDDSKGGQQEMSLQRQYMEALRQQGDHQAQGVWGGSGSATDDGNNGSGSWTMNLPGFHSSSTGGHGGGLL